jgi:hypothetical protein
MKNYYWLHIRGCDHKNHVFAKINEIEKIPGFTCFVKSGKNSAYIMNLRYQFNSLSVYGSYSCDKKKNNFGSGVYCKDLFHEKIEFHDLINNIHDGTAITFITSKECTMDEDTDMETYYTVFDEEYNENVIKYFKNFLPNSYELKSAMPVNVAYEDAVCNDEFYDFYKNLFILRERLLTKSAKLVAFE